MEVSMPFPESVDGGIIVRDEVGYPTGPFGFILVERMTNEIK